MSKIRRHDQNSASCTHVSICAPLLFSWFIIQMLLPRRKLELVSLLIVCLSITVSLVSVMVMRYTSNLASHLARKRQEDTFWLDVDKTSFWYALKSMSTYPDVQSKFIQMYEDAETKAFLQQSVAQADSWVLQSWYTICKSFMSLFSYSQTDMNAILQRGSMFVISTEQFELLLNHGGITSEELSSRRDAATLIDLGAGDGKVTEKMRPFFAQLFATEVSRPMRTLLSSRGITVLDIDSWGYRQHFDLISCLNLLDRCDNPIDIIQTIKTALKPNGLLLLALVLPFSPYVEQRKSREPSQVLNITGAEFIDQVDSVVQVFQSVGFVLKSWTRVPYLCEGDSIHSVYTLDDAVFLFQLQQ